MASVSFLVAALAALTPPACADLSGTSISLLAPLEELDPSRIYTFVFGVDRDWSSEEYVTEIDLTFPIGLFPLSGTMGYDETAPGRPSFNMWPYLDTASWWEQDPVNGGIHIGESTQIWVDVVTSELIPEGGTGVIVWRVEGNWMSVQEGECYVSTPVTGKTWGSIKATFRRDP